MHQLFWYMTLHVSLFLVYIKSYHIYEFAQVRCSQCTENKIISTVAPQSFWSAYEMCKIIAFLKLLFSKNEYIFIPKHITCLKYTQEVVPSLESVFLISISSSQAAVKTLDVYLSRAKFSSISFSSLAAVTNPDVYLSWVKFSSSQLHDSYKYLLWLAETSFHRLLKIFISTSDELNLVQNR